MSADKHNPTNTKSSAAQDGSLPTTAQQVNRAQADVSVADVGSGSYANMLLWLLAIVSFIAAATVGEYLPRYWQPANSVWVKWGVIAGLSVLGVVLMLLTKQGRGFFKLLSDARTELLRVTWPSKEETFEYTWKVLVVMVIAGLLVWLLDIMLNPVIEAIIG